ncbi:MAG: hypothetical protein GKR77_03510 [Legionellales bacterium]|nr:hypothetical protein [Legionellales bacterium]
MALTSAESTKQLSLAEKKRIRKGFSKTLDQVMEIPPLLALQLDSYRTLLQKDVAPDQLQNIGLHAAFDSIFPIESFSGHSRLEYVSYSLGESLFDVMECKLRGLTYAAPVRVKLRLVIFDKDNAGNEKIRDIREQEVYMGEMPLMTEVGTFVINGTERVVVSQLHRSPGVFFEHDKGKNHSSGKLLYSARIIPYRGSWLDFEFDPKDNVFVRIDRRRKLPVTILLKALGYTTEEILQLFFISNHYTINAKQEFVLTLEPSRLLGENAMFDIVDKQGNVIVENGRRITARHIRQMENAKLTKLVTSSEYLIGKTIAKAIVDQTSGEILVEANAEITADVLKTLLENSVTEFETLYINELDNGPYISTTLRIDPSSNQLEALVEIYRMMRPGEPPTKDAAENVKMMNAYKVELAKGEMSLNDVFNNIEAKSVGAKAVNESGNVKTTMGPAPKNLKPAADKWLQDNPNASAKKAMEVFLNESDKYLKTGIVNERNIKDRRKTLGISSPEGKNINKLSAERKENTFTDFKSNLEGVDMNDPQAVLDVFRNSYKKGYAETTAAKQYEETGSLSQSQSANKKINDLIDEFENTEGGFKISKQNEIDKLKPKKKDTSDIYAEYYRKEFSPNTAVINVKKSSEFRFFNNKRRTLDDQTPQEFFSQYSLKDIEKGGKFHNEYLQFKAIDDVRIKNVENLQPILRKIFTKVREGTPNQKESLVNLNIAHKFESSGIKKGYVSPTKTGKGTDPTEIYIDVSEYNQTIQPSLEAEARKFYNKYIEFGDEAARKEYLKIDKDMKILGIEGQVAPGQTVGKAMPFDDKIRQLADEAINNNFITQTEYDQLINSAEEIAQSKIDFFNTFGIKSKYASGGLVGINHLTRPLRNF